ncbi:DUF6215 domain-containing protein [Kitasatospora sp. NPDC048296]|uniref:DUF6215 domain-containing protein n=1 Tax=Kitasatospora sp. NPDC048296 TaxID=3364048 RepID=UPI003710DE13
METNERNNKAVIAAGAVIVVACGAVAALAGTGALKPHRADATCAPSSADLPADYAAFCAALNRSDLPTLLGTPDDRVSTAGPGPFKEQKETMAEVRLQDTVVNLSESPVSAWSMGDWTSFGATRVTVLGHPAVTTWGRTMTLFAPGGKSSQDGPTTRNLVIAKNAKDPGGRAFEITVFRQDGKNVDDAVVQRVAEAVVPNLPGWVAAP